MLVIQQVKRRLTNYDFFLNKMVRGIEGKTGAGHATKDNSKISKIWTISHHNICILEV